MRPALRLVLILITVILPLTRSSQAAYLALSLNQLEQASRGGRHDTEIIELAGITRLLGLVVDPDGDLLIIGRRDPDLPSLRRDHLVAALRALFIFDAYPLVSLDATADTIKTGRLHVRFEGGVERTCLGQDLLVADIALKRLALGLAGVALVPSYLELSAEEPDAAGQIVHTRFWFVPGDKTRLVQRDGVFAIRRLDVTVRTELVGANFRDPAAERFAQSVADALGKVAAVIPEIAQVKPLFDIAALAGAIKAVRSAEALSYWLTEYRPEGITTPETFAVLRSQHVRAGSQVIEAEGGIDLEVLMQSLTEGDTNALRTAVLLARPSSTSLVWSVPLTSWPTDDAPSLRGDADERGAQSVLLRHLGASIIRRPASVATDQGGVFLGVVPQAGAADLETLRGKVLEGRGSGPFWQIKP